MRREKNRFQSKTQGFGVSPWHCCQKILCLGQSQTRVGGKKIAVGQSQTTYFGKSTAVGQYQIEFWRKT